MISRLWHGWTRAADADTYEDMSAVKAFAGPDYTLAVIHPEARRP